MRGNGIVTVDYNIAELATISFLVAIYARQTDRSTVEQFLQPTCSLIAAPNLHFGHPVEIEELAPAGEAESDLQ